MHFYFKNRVCFLWPLILLVALLTTSCNSGDGDSVATVETTRDNMGVWFISGSDDATIYNIFEAYGYAVATDRLWQAEVYRRSARGTLAEVFGPSQLDSDIFMRTTGYSQEELQNAFDALDEEVKDIVQGYVDGFNLRIAEVIADSSILPFEFKSLGIVPGNWSVLDVLAWSAVLLRSFDPEATSQFQIENLSLLAALAKDFPGDYQGMFADLRWTNDPQALTYYDRGNRQSVGKTGSSSTPMSAGKAGTSVNPLPSMEKTVDYSSLAHVMSSRYEKIEHNLKEINAFVKMGSYAWVVSGEKTQSGNPIIYSGPQMGFATPSIVLEGSIRAGGLDVSGMSVPGIPGIIIGRTPHHAWSMQVANGHTTDYYLESTDSVILHRTERIKVAGEADFELPIYRTSHGPVINPMPYDPSTVSADNPIIAWKYSHWGYELDTIGSLVKLARARSMDEFGEAVETIAVSQHFCYADVDANIAYYMSGRDPVRPDGNWMLPQGVGNTAPLEWDAAVLKTRSTDRNASKGYYCGWNNKDSSGSESGMNTSSKQFGLYHRAHVVDDYFAANNNLTFEDLRDLIQNITTTDSFGNGGNPWEFVSEDFISAVTDAGLTLERQNALDIMASWDGHFVDGGLSKWVLGTDRADGWKLMDAWIGEVIRLTFEDELSSLFQDQDRVILFNVILHGLAGKSSGIINNYNWFQNSSDDNAPQTAHDIIATALDNVLVTLGSRPWGKDEREKITYTHDLIGEVHAMPFSSRSTYAQCVEMGSTGPIRIETMFPLGESGNILMNTDGTPLFDDNFFNMAPLFDTMTHRNFPLFD